ncbi:MAG: redoxin domain-containing protein, partial [Phycisphaerae bacterium]|nr:redoxin domain-containing protein [Phycisphaerae bacterium]
AGLALAGDDNETAGPTITIGDKAPAIDIAHWVKGVEVKKNKMTPITEFEAGKVYVLEFWATWCGPCIMGMPHLSELQERYADYDVTIIGVSDEPLPTVIDFLFKKDKRDGKLHNDRTKYVLTTDPDESVKNDYFRAAGRTGIPCAFIIGKDSHVEWIGHPAQMDAPLEAIVFDTWDRDEYREKAAKKQAQQTKLRAAYQSEDWDTVLDIFDSMIEADPKNVSLMMQKFNLLLLEMDKPMKAYSLGYQLLEHGWDDAAMLNAIAWTVADDKRVNDRNLDFAKKAALRANELTEGKDAAIMDTVARIYFEQGRIQKAVEWQRKAVAHAAEGQLADQLRAALETYEKAMKR